MLGSATAFPESSFGFNAINPQIRLNRLIRGSWISGPYQDDKIFFISWPLLRNIYKYNTDVRAFVNHGIKRKCFGPVQTREWRRGDVTHMQIFDVRLHRLQLLSNVRGRLLVATGMMGRGGRGGGEGSVPAFQVRREGNLFRHGILPQGEDADEARAKENENPLKWSWFCEFFFYLCVM